MKERQIKTQYRKIFFNKIDDFMNMLIKILTYSSAVFLLVLLLLFYYLNNLQLDYYVDEKFHIPQTLQFCKGQFFEWDQKITTFPGLYLFSALILGPVNLCTVTFLRLINVLCTYLNLILSLQIINFLNRKHKNMPYYYLRSYSLFLIAWNITFFPPLFFWFFLYYTDVFSVTLILLMFLFYLYDKNKTAAFVGVVSICVRQTNVVWVAFLSIDKSLTLIDEITKKPQYTDTLNLFLCIQVLSKIFRAEIRNGIIPFFKFMKLTWKPIFPYTLVLISFIIFVIYNEGIVIGDRTAHVPTIHLSQIFYFSLFVFCFSWPYLLPFFSEFLQVLCKNIILLSFSLCCIILIVHFNTLVHPYILADNRHYSFYVWKNFMNRYVFFKYLLVPIYVFAIFSIFKSLRHLRLLSLFAYILCVCIVLIPQLLLEPRYFITPYILFRLNQKQPKNWQIVAETLTTFFINIGQFFIFVKKSFHWEDEEYPQRIGW